MGKLPLDLSAILILHSGGRHGERERLPISELLNGCIAVVCRQPHLQVFLFPQEAGVSVGF